MYSYKAFSEYDYSVIFKMVKVDAEGEVMTTKSDLSPHVIYITDDSEAILQLRFQLF